MRFPDSYRTFEIQIWVFENWSGSYRQKQDPRFHKTQIQTHRRPDPFFISIYCKKCLPFHQSPRFSLRRVSCPLIGWWTWCRDNIVYRSNISITSVVDLDFLRVNTSIIFFIVIYFCDKKQYLNQWNKMLTIKNLDGHIDNENNNNAPHKQTNWESGLVLYGLRPNILNLVKRPSHWNLARQSLLVLEFL